MIATAEIGAAVEADGFAIVEGVLSRAMVDHLLTSSLASIGDTGSVRKRGGIFAVRNLLDVSPEVRELAHSEAVRALVAPVLGERFFPVRGILFDKIPDANWKVPWHQDVTIAVQERVEAEGFRSQLRTCNEREQQLHNILSCTRLCVVPHASAELQINQAVHGSKHETGQFP